ncbi:MAG: PH domain-containing protein [Actinobacteria bacterium]|nr:PH domain-containing protein [Actinomycetota bacterium]
MIVKPEKELKIIWYMSALILFTASLIIILSFFLFSDVNIWIPIGFSTVWLISLIIALIWVPAAYRAIEYYIQQDSVKMKGGVFWRKHVTIPNRKITNIDITQGPFERFLKIGTIHVQTAGAGGQQGQKAELKISGVREMGTIRDAIINNIIPSTVTGVGEAEIPLRTYSTETASGVSTEKGILFDILTTLKSIDERLKK